jgi:pimeloyl-ACP methyl ester carboxylesterase
MRFTIKTVVSLLVLACVVLVAARLAAHLRETELLEAVVPQEGRLIETAMGRIFVLDEGAEDAPVVLFAHGTAAWSGLWQPVLEEIGADGWRAVAFDMPPFGYSERALDGDYSRTRQAERILALVEALGTRPILVAHSIGAGPGVEAVMRRPDYFAGLVVVDGALGLNSHESGKSLPAPLRLGPLREAVTALTMNNPLLTGTFLRQLIHVDAAATDEVLTVLKAPFVREGTTESYADWVPSLLVPPQDALSTRPDSYAALSLPVAYIWGEDDTVTPLEQGEELARVTPGARLLTIPDSGHIPQIETPDAFLLVLRDALGFISPGRDTPN